MTSISSTSVFAPAKINLYLHVTGKRDDGYHDLDSWIGFVDIGDKITVTYAKNFSLKIEGRYAAGLSAGPSNLVWKAAHRLAEILDIPPDIQITLTKNLPVSSGVGGGSADAAATIKALLKLWGESLSPPKTSELARSLGADFSVCYSGKSSRILGVGHVMEAAPILPKIHIILINPGKTCSTPEVFSAYEGPYKPPLEINKPFKHFEDLITFLNAQSNSLLPTAAKLVPEIHNVLDVLRSDPDCALARLSGSGATCFGLYKTKSAAVKATEAIRQKHPTWWVKNGHLIQAM